MTVSMDEADMTPEDVGEVKRKKENAKAKLEQDARALQEALNTRLGRRLLYRQLENCGMFRDCVSTDREASLVLIGGHMKAVALWGELIAMSPALVGKMIEENG